MAEKTEGYQIFMILSDGYKATNADLSKEYCFKNYQPGDEQLWLEIHRDAEKWIPLSEERYLKEFGEQKEDLKQRQVFLFHESGEVVGTATAWHDERFLGEAYGRIHWVAIKSKYQGLGLSRALVSYTCNRLIELGHERIYLSTSSQRLAAIKTYLRLGFQPYLQTDLSKQAWLDYERRCEA